jgi:hypothetical protein
MPSRILQKQSVVFLRVTTPSSSSCAVLYTPQLRQLDIDSWPQKIWFNLKAVHVGFVTE